MVNWELTALNLIALCTDSRLFSLCYQDPHDRQQQNSDKVGAGLDREVRLHSQFRHMWDMC